MEQHLKDLLSALNSRAVRYVVVGSYALAVHAQPRATGDLDVLVDTDPVSHFIIPPEDNRSTWPPRHTRLNAPSVIPQSCYRLRDFI